MHNPFDHLAKKVGKGALDTSGATVVQYEISRDAQHADLRHDPDPARAAERARLGLLGRIAATLCIIEVYGRAPDGRDFRSCLSKHLAHWEECLNKARAQARRREQRGLPQEPFAAPFLWILVATFSAPMLRELRAVRARGWPAGVYVHGGDLYRVGILIADRLPRNRSTLLVRIMAAGPGLADAIAELARLPPDAVERTVAEQVVVHLEHVLGKKPSRTPEEEELIVKMQKTWETARQMARAEGRTEGRDEGRTEGRAEGHAEARAGAVLTALRVRAIPVSDADRERILAEKDPARLERWLERAIVAASIAEVLAEPGRAA